MKTLLDLFCYAGGASRGYHNAGFLVTGVDLKSPRYFGGDRFILGDAFEYIKKYGHLFDAITASPPCQKYSKSTLQWRKTGTEYPDMVQQVRDILVKTGKPFVIENVPGSPLIDPIFLNGYMFGRLVHRPRYFECSFPIEQPTIVKQKHPVKMGRKVVSGDIIQPVGHFSNVRYAREQMGIDWMNQKELSQAIPPCYTEYIGKYLMECVMGKSVAL